MEKIIGTFNKMERSTYAECARVTLWERSDGGAFRATIEDGILYLWELQEDGRFTIISANSTFDLRIDN